MKSRTFKVVALFLVMGLGSGLLSIFIGTLSKAWMWLGLSAILLPGLVVSIIIASRLKWLSLRLSVPRCLLAVLIIVASYPLSILVMFGSALFYGRLYAALLPLRWRERLNSGDGPDANEGIIIGLYLAAIVGAILVSVALRVLTQKWDRRAMLLMIVAGLVTIPLSEAIGLLIGERDWFLVLFPVGEALFSALCGYWLLRASAAQENELLV